MTNSPATDDALCLDCNYLLRGLESIRCPECGRPFDRDDPATMNLTGRPFGRLSRRLLRPVNWLTLALAALATAGILATSRWPLPGNWRFSFCDAVDQVRLGRQFLTRPLHGWEQWTYFLALGLAALVTAVWLLRLMTRASILLFRRPPRALRRRGRREWAMLLLALLSLAGAGLGWPHRVAEGWQRSGWPPGRLLGYPFVPPPFPALDTEQTLAVLRCLIMEPPDPRTRIDNLNILLSVKVEAGRAILERAIGREQNLAVLEAELHLLCLYRDPTTAPLFARLLGDPRPTIRAAAADALGILHQPAYPIPLGFWPFVLPQAQIASDPPVDIQPLIRFSTYGGTRPPYYRSDDRIQDKPIELPGSIRNDLERMMLSGATSAEREAAARALVTWPPKDYRLRVAEWGVWLSENGQIKLAQSVLDEIPPFVHRTANPIAEFGDRINQIMIITKPVLHVSADRPMAVDMEVRIRDGRPWFAYPRPDDFALSTATYASLTTQPHQPVLGPLDNTHLPSLQPTAEGYPWLSPQHQRRGSIGGSDGDQGNEAIDVGLHWQSLIVSPQPQAWMQPPQVPADAKYQWWNRLRQVPSSWVASQGESERFLYYDGPTLAAAPWRAHFDQGQLRLEKIVENPEHRRHGVDAPTTLPQTRSHGPAALLVKVSRGQAQAWRIDVPPDGGEVALPAPVTGTAQAVVAFTRLLTDAGLTAEEAAGMVDSWKTQFFAAEGTRLLLLMSGEDYDRFCPITIRPAPTELVRVGLLLTEFSAAATRPAE